MNPSSRARREPGALVLENGEVFAGELFGAPPSVLPDSDQGYGEVVFNTSLTGYQEILTDPSYYGQIVAMTAAHVGNTGMNSEDPESRKIWCAGFVIQELEDTPSSWRAEESLDATLKRQGIPGLCGVDTRRLTLLLREVGVARGVIVPRDRVKDAGPLLAQAPKFEGRDLIVEVLTREAYDVGAPTPGAPLVVAMDFGIKTEMLRKLKALRCNVRVVGANTSAADILAAKPAGIFLSNGPGDPAAAPYAAETIRALLRSHVPIFGVCMGHQLLAIALGAKTYKLKYGHRGSNHPVKDLAADRVEISSHNHGYAVDARTLPSSARVTHISLNDQTAEGLELIDRDSRDAVFSVQYHPEACPGPHDSEKLFDKFAACFKNT